jgi:hypothetical protein
MVSINSFAAQYILIFLFLISVTKLLSISSIFAFFGSLIIYLWTSWHCTKFMRRKMEKQTINTSGKAVLITGIEINVI